MPVGVVDPRVTIVDGKQVQARALVDLDVIRKSKVRGWLDPLAYVTGRVELTAAGLLTGANGKGPSNCSPRRSAACRFRSQCCRSSSATTRSRQNCRTASTSTSPSICPQNIRQVEIQRGAATIVQ